MRSDSRRLLLLLVWVASVVLPALHAALEDEFDGSRGGLAREAGCAACEHATPPAHPSAPAIEAACSGDDCTNPHHHHHSIAHPDPSQCPICSTQLLRVADAPLAAFALAPHEVKFVRAFAARLRPVAARRVIALARGPPGRPTLG